MFKKKNKSKHTGKIIDSKNNFDVIDCDECDFIHVMPIPSDKKLKEIYQDKYYVNEKPNYIEHSLEDIEWWESVYHDRLLDFESLLLSDQRKILDIGCGSGLFLKTAKEKGWDVTGIEPSLEAYNYSKNELGLNIHNFFLNDKTKNELEKFHVINLYEVLEHIRNPIKLLKIVNEKLYSDGLICVVVPNDYNPFQIAINKLYQKDKWWIDPPHHLNYFSFNSLSGLLEKAGFEVVKKESTFPIDIFLLMGKNYIGNETEGKNCHEMRKSFELNLLKSGMNDFKRNLFKQFSKLNIGREIILIGKKVK